MNEEIKINLDELEKNIEEQTAEEIKNTEKHQGENQTEESLDNIPRKEDGTIDIDLISLGKDDKGNIVVNDSIFDKYYKEMPKGIVNQSHTWRTSNGGRLKILGGDPDNDRLIQMKGAEHSNAMQAQRRTFKEVIEEMLCSRASKDAIEDLNLKADATNLEMIIASAARQAERGNVKAMDFLRDTIGQKPSDRLEATVENLTPEDRAMLENIKNRLSE
jgi:hypothetical protein